MLVVLLKALNQVLDLALQVDKTPLWLLLAPAVLLQGRICAVDASILHHSCAPLAHPLQQLFGCSSGLAAAPWTDMRHRQPPSSRLQVTMRSSQLI